MVEVTICIGSSCHVRGSSYIVSRLQKIIKERNLEDKILLKASFCMGDCKNGACITVDKEKITGVSPANIEEIFENKIMVLLK